LPATLVALEQGRITLSKARILHAETANLSDEHTAEVEQQVLAKVHRQTPGQLRVATRRAVLSTDPAAVRKRAEQARRAAVARDLAAAGTWRRILTDPASGRPVDYGTTRYRPPEHLTGLVVTRDQTCQFPGCRVPAHRCDMEHGIPHDPVNGAGPTSENNLGAKCQRHHQVKQTPAPF
jgi:hypothetical protein